MQDLETAMLAAACAVAAVSAITPVSAQRSSRAPQEGKPVRDDKKPEGVSAADRATVCTIIDRQHRD